MWCRDNPKNVGRAASYLKLGGVEHVLNNGKQVVLLDDRTMPVEDWRVDHEADYERACKIARQAAFPPVGPSLVDEAFLQELPVVIGAALAFGTGWELNRRSETRRKREMEARLRQINADMLAAKVSLLEACVRSVQGMDPSDPNLSMKQAEATEALFDIRQRLDDLRESHPEWLLAGSPLSARVHDVGADPLGALGPASGAIDKFLADMRTLAQKVQRAENGDRDSIAYMEGRDADR